MQPTTEIRRRPDGSIDLDHYVKTGRERRAGALREMLRAAGATRLFRLFPGRRRPAPAAPPVANCC